MRTLLLIFVLALMPGCGQAQDSNRTLENKVPPVPSETQDTKPKTAETGCRICDFDFAAYKGELKKEEIDGLLLALNDEYMAWATYDRINKDFNSPRPFINIQQAEARHIERLKMLFSKYGIAVPENKWIGSTPKFETVNAACKAGVDAEIANRELYGRLFKSTQREDIIATYRDLQRASEENHRPAFERCTQGGGRGPGGRRF